MVMEAKALPRAVVSKLETQSLCGLVQSGPKAGQDWHPISKTVWQRAILHHFTFLYDDWNFWKLEAELDGYLQLWCSHQVW